MAERQRCAVCGKEAIGFQSIGCCFAHVCSEHADSLLLHLKPGEKRSSGECYVERFDTADS
ncbi:hypothetical protein [Methanoregula sp.]|uniref:hypothetical protein n=1 Tax=Methanoregula sp. TaxID=2052170 RepID=UPI00356775DF